ncbi:MAG: hypothetical protein HN793_07295 [Rhodospirillaceae bacterium]|jgi:hypothetical protein|nr:hypothetical protein [Rhodospirillaceae bacterium]MBT5241051.1 hypothetical protein [Rhodospirillaceae bacterium]MBT5564667.1 hypothetical protein [Rhodospirillaceae bacterium]MBT6091002.1 hypothetical protein [Rhodospirillaceae bacterium]MBT7450617.1 hypothetical protein [Rhodospirillaceae bacterium]
MLAELFRYWTTFAPERVRKFGYLKRLIDLEFRHERNEHAWADHILSCRTFIVEAADKCPKQGTAVVLGSGLLLEVPLRSLAERFDRVYLVDMFHMPQVRVEAKKHFNVKLLYGDVTGIFAMMGEGDYPGGSIPAPEPRIPHLKDADLIVSVNCLTHLSPPICAHLDHARHLTEFDQDRLTLQIMAAHVDAIANTATGVGAVITDTERFVLAGDRVVSRRDLIPGLNFPDSASRAHNLEWQWLMSPAGEDHETHDIEHTVVTRLYERFIIDEEEEEDGLADDAPDDDGPDPGDDDVDGLEDV